MGIKELDRVKVNNELSSMPVNPWQFEVDLGADAETSLAKLKQVLELIAFYSVEDWPSDDQWRELMPEWLRENIPELTKEQTDKLLADTPQAQWDSLPWEFLSWLDAIRDRGWSWWGYLKNSDSNATLVVHIAMIPERIDAFKELLKVIGMRIKSESYAHLSSHG